MLPTEAVLRPSSGWQLLNLAELWHFRDLFCFLIWRDVKVRYKQTVLGVAWALLQPALMMVVFTIFFSRLAGLSSGSVPYPIFVYSGLVAWTFFATGLSTACNSVVGSERLITKIYFPRLTVPFAAVGAAVVDLLVSLALLCALMIGFRVELGWQVLLMLPVLAALVLFTAGLGTLLAALNVAYRDFRYVVPFLIQLWLFATPAIYLDLFASSATETSGVTSWMWLNPLTGLVAGFRAATLGTPIPWWALGYAGIAAVLVFVAGCFYFRRMEDSFADII